MSRICQPFGMSSAISRSWRFWHSSRRVGRSGCALPRQCSTQATSKCRPMPPRRTGHFRPFAKQYSGKPTCPIGRMANNLALGSQRRRRTGCQTTPTTRRFDPDHPGRSGPHRPERGTRRDSSSTRQTTEVEFRQWTPAGGRRISRLTLRPMPSSPLRFFAPGCTGCDHFNRRERNMRC